MDILYEDDALLFVNKPAGIVVQRGYDAEEPVLLEQAADYAGHLFLMQRLDRGKRAVTIVTPLRATPLGSLVAIDLMTGRTHQIRVHLAAIGHPLAGDWLYGQRNEVRPMLHARELSM